MENDLEAAYRKLGPYLRQYGTPILPAPVLHRRRNSLSHLTGNRIPVRFSLPARHANAVLP